MRALDGFEDISLVPKKGSSVLTVTKSNIRFNKPTAAELGYPPYTKMLLNAKTNQVAIQECTEKDPAGFAFCGDAKKHNYAIFIKVPALLAEFRRLLDLGDGSTYSMTGITYPDEKAIIYDLKEAMKEEGKKKQKIGSAEEPEKRSETAE